MGTVIHVALAEDQRNHGYMFPDAGVTIGTADGRTAKTAAVVYWYTGRITAVPLSDLIWLEFQWVEGGIESMVLKPNDDESVDPSSNIVAFNPAGPNDAGV